MLKENEKCRVVIEKSIKLTKKLKLQPKIKTRKVIKLITLQLWCFQFKTKTVSIHHLIRPSNSDYVEPQTLAILPTVSLLTSTEKAEIDTFADINLGVNEISKRVIRYKSTIMRYHWRAKHNNAHTILIRVKKLLHRDTRKIFQTTLDGRRSATEVRNVLSQNAIPRDIQEVQRECPYTQPL